MIKLNSSVGKPYVDSMYPPGYGVVRASYSIRSDGSTIAGLNVTAIPGYDRPITEENLSSLVFFIPASGNETTVTILHHTSSDRPIFDLYINDVLDSSGYDQYSASDVHNLITVTPINTINRGWNKITLKCNGKNASSTGYKMYVAGVRLI